MHETHFVWLAALSVCIALAATGAALAALRRARGLLGEANAELSRRATHDALTRLPNRALLMDRIEKAILAAASDDGRFALLYVDIDRFKTVNESFGHRAGDELLCAAAERLAGCLQRGDLLGRLGADEFVIVLDAIEDAGAAATTAARIVAAFGPALCAGPLELHTSLSIGIGVYPEDGKEAEILMTNADAAMDHAKRSGGGGFQFFAPAMNALARERLELEYGLRRGLEKNEFELHYQPKVDIASNRVIGMEALLRWRTADKGIVPPGVFIPVAEEIGLIGQLGEWVLRTACAQNKAWQRVGMRPMRVAVNLSAKQFRHSRLFEFIDAVLKDTGLEPRYLELEITESTVMHDAEASVLILEQLSGLGVEVSIDDFGTGYSSLSYLRRLPLAKLKIDRSFVNDVASNQDDAAIVRAVVSLAHSLRLKVIAEGVETGAQLAFLRSLGCDEYQGFLCSPAIDADAFSAFMRLNRGGVRASAPEQPADSGAAAA